MPPRRPARRQASPPPAPPGRPGAPPLPLFGGQPPPVPDNPYRTPTGDDIQRPAADSTHRPGVDVYGWLVGARVAGTGALAGRIPWVVHHDESWTSGATIHAVATM